MESIKEMQKNPNPVVYHYTYDLNVQFKILKMISVIFATIGVSYYEKNYANM